MGRACLLPITRVHETVGRDPNGRIELANALLLETLCAMPGLPGRDPVRPVLAEGGSEVTSVLLYAVAASTASDSVAMRMAWS